MILSLYKKVILLTKALEQKQSIYKMVNCPLRYMFYTAKDDRSKLKVLIKWQEIAGVLFL